MNSKSYFKLFILLVIICLQSTAKAENGYDLWLRYKAIKDTSILSEYRNLVQNIAVLGNSPTIDVIKKELKIGLNGLLDSEINIENELNDQTVIIGNIKSSSKLTHFIDKKELARLSDEGFLIKNIKTADEELLVVTSKTDVGVLYGTFHLLRLIQTKQLLSKLYILENPKTKLRLLNHWDNLDRTVERGYAGFSIWDWHKLPDYISQRYKDYARANASVGINGTVVSNVNANALILTPEYLHKLQGLADAFRPYGIRVYLTARFSAPIEIGGLKTADPLNEDVIKWWKTKIEEIYSIIPDFGGFLIKANSEGQPGPQEYGRNHADGANLLAHALEPYNGVVMWRAFVYDNEVPDDRAKQAYNEFKPLDGKFDSNVLVQVKNGAIDFQPREPFHPMFGAIEKTPLMMEFQITQEYLGCATHLVFLAPLYKETLKSDTYVQGKGSSVASVVDGSIYNHKISGMAGVSNIGNDINWTGHPFAQANWYAFGRLAWNHELSSKQIADEWIRMTFTNESKFLNAIKPVMLQSREVAVNYMTPLGLHHQMAWDHHWGPGPWVNIGRVDWTSAYYHRADSLGIGFNRSSTGSNAVSQYSDKVKEIFDNIDSCPEEVLLWFHHVSWNYQMNSGLTLWEELCEKYYSGAESVKQMQATWNTVEGLIDEDRFIQVQQLLSIQAKEAVWWRNALLLYFQQYSKQAIPEKYEQPDKSIEYYENLEFHFVPGI